MPVVERFQGCFRVISSVITENRKQVPSSRGAKRRGDSFTNKFYGRWIASSPSAPRNDAALVLLTLLLALPCHADPNTYLIKHQTGKNSKSILDKKFVHLNAPSQAVVNSNSSNDTKGLETLSSNIQKAIPIIKSKPLVIKPSKTKTSPVAKDNSSWNDYAVEAAEEEGLEELEVNAILLR